MPAPLGRDATQYLAPHDADVPLGLYREPEVAVAVHAHDADDARAVNVDALAGEGECEPR
jgi:hypothetical protein